MKSISLIDNMLPLTKLSRMVSLQLLLEQSAELGL